MTGRILYRNMQFPSTEIFADLKMIPVLRNRRGDPDTLQIGTES